MNKTHKTAVVVIPSLDVWDPIQEIRAKHDRKMERWMPHITLLYPFVPRESFDEAEEQLAAACADLVPFEITLARFRFFDHGRGRYTAWLSPEPPDPLVRLQAALEAAVPVCDDQRRHEQGFTPHLSVGQFRKRIRAREFTRSSTEKWIASSFTVREICIISRDDPPDDVFGLDRTVALGR